MIGRIPRRTGELILAGAIVLALATGSFLTHPQAAFAAGLDGQPARHVVVFTSQETQTLRPTSARTVADFLKERGITPGPADYVHPSPDTAISDDMYIDYAAAVPVTLIDAANKKHLVSTAADIGGLLEEQGIHLRPTDVVTPSLSQPIGAGEVVRITRVARWTAALTIPIAPKTVHRLDFALPPGETKIVDKGSAGKRLAYVSFTTTNGKLKKQTLVSRVLRKPRERVLAEGVGAYAGVAEFAGRGLQKASFIAADAMDMVATAYTASCDGCSGYTASGYHAGRGIVAVDPSIIPLGTKLFIPGYGFAIAGDTGGAIHGYRIDLGFDSFADAVQFGRRTIKVYTLR